MLELKRITANPDELQSMLIRRGIKDFDTINLAKLIQATNTAQQSLDELRSQRNTASKEIGVLIGKGDKEAAESQKAAVSHLGDEINRLETDYNTQKADLDEFISGLPNWIADGVPDGLDETSNQELKVVGQKPEFDFKPRTHYEIGEGMGILDFERGVKLAGSRYYTYRGLLARLERALISFMLDTHAKNGYTEVFVPQLINDAGMFTTGQFPKFRGEYYNLERDGLNLIPTAEVPLVNLYRDDIIAESDLPVALTAASSCFRREAGAAGKDTRGLVRVHQFQKVELVQLVHPDESERIHTEMLAHAESILQALGLPYRVVLLCAGDMGATAVKTYDIEVWMPGLNRWLEISSVSNCLDYQARRGMIRYKGNEKKARASYVHTLNGSGVAAGRCMIAIMENYQNKDGAFDIPDVLQTYLR
ncbi:MAG: serine--tRNA ligase [Leptospiraceae bacterium]|nr:serine--tRNA ligase [Leptospiraceae bacterium]